MIDHTGVSVSDFDAALAPIDARLLNTVPMEFTNGNNIEMVCHAPSE